MDKDTLNTPFLYDVQVRKLLANRNHAYWVSGGRGIGKTTFLDHVFNKVKKRGNFHTVQINGRLANCAEQIREVAEKAKSKSKANFAIFIDDAERLINQKNVLDSIKNIYFSFDKEKSEVIILSSSYPLKDAIKKFNLSTYDPFLSDIVWGEIELNPWSRGWEAKVKQHLKDRLPHVSEELLKQWWKAIFRVTGGHPVFLGPVFETIARIVSTPEEERTTFEELLLGKSENLPESFGDDLKFYLSDKIETKGIHRITRAVDMLKETNIEALDRLIELSLLESDPDNDKRNGKFRGESQMMRMAIKASGLAFQDERSPSKLIIAGEITRGIIKKSKDILVEKVNLELGTYDDQSNQAILWAVTPSNIKISFILTQSMSRLVDSLMQAGGQPVTRDELKKKIGIEAKDKALESLIQRFRTLLKEQGVDKVIQNVRNVGYKIGNEPILIRKL